MALVLARRVPKSNRLKQPRRKGTDVPAPVFASDLPILALARARWRELRDTWSPRRKLLAKLRASWGRRSDKPGYLANRYFTLVRNESPARWVDDKTWDDLEFPELFARMDTTVTPVGGQVLYAQLRQYVDDRSVLAQRFAGYLELAGNQPLREALQLRLAKLGDEANADLADLLFAQRIEKPARRVLIWAWALVSLALLVLAVFFQVALWFWFGVLLVNAAVIMRQGWRQGRETEAMQHCAKLLDVADRLAAMRGHAQLPAVQRLHDEAPQRAVIRKALFWFACMNILKALPPPFSVLPAFLNFAFLTNLAVHAGTVERFHRLRGRLHATFALVGEIDATVAVASFLQQYPQHCAPAFTQNRELSMTEGCHPLLPDGVTNSTRLERQSLLVTGSNMAGKTTFIKMLACNAILGQTLGFCLAASATLPRAAVLASIHGAHSVESGKSHYFAEIEAIDGFIRHATPERTRIIALDEPFSGTNTVERIAVARAILEALGQNAIVLATTHDVELQAMLGDAYVLCHFQENPDVEGYFDYTLKPGPATERNAIRLLQRMGFPEAITANAMAYAARDMQADLRETC
ncbi:MAG: hypothetical protein EPN36_01800 [Rhodanobacteraceae bacterium]|nr:MAG: hypothetical protein EPN36_01800 [Rhodanobacteraceae bacterium]